MSEASNPFHEEAKYEPPSWLANKESNYAPVTNAESAQITNYSDPQIPRLILYTRIANVILSICMILVSFLALFTTSVATTGVLACYVMAFSYLICCFEMHFKSVAKFILLNFGFMYSAKCRSFFMVLVGMLYF
jgi:hypothetical protein